MKWIIALILFCCTNESFSQDVKKEVHSFFMRSKRVNNYSYTIFNNGDSPLWIWFNKKNINSSTQESQIRNYFLIPSKETDIGSYYQLMCDINVYGFVGSLFIFWTKVIPPKESFTIYLIGEGQCDENWVQTIESHVSIVNEIELTRQCPGIENEIVKKLFTEQAPSIIISWEQFKQNLSE